MELQIVSFEQAEKLKEIGFPQDAFYNHYYTEEGKRYWMKMSDDYGNSWSIGQYHFSCVAPTLEVVAKWLREEKDFDIEPHREGDKYTLLYTWFDNRINGYNVEYIDVISGECKCFEFNTYEEALSAGINKAIEILKNFPKNSPKSSV